MSLQCLTNIRSVLDGAGSTFNNEEDGYGRGGARRPVRKERDDKVHDSIIEERIQRERPCRTLFIRNIKASRVIGLTSEYKIIFSPDLNYIFSMKPIVEMSDANLRNTARSKHFSI